MWANLVIGANKATTLRGSSTPLSSPRDRQRFHHLRSQARAIVIGGSTFRHEPYRTTPIPLYVATRAVNPEMIARNPSARFHVLSPREIVSHAASEMGEPILIEAGARFISELLDQEVITKLFLTRSALDGDNDFFNIDQHLASYICSQREVSENDTFEIWELLPERN